MATSSADSNMSKPSAKFVLLEHVSRDIKALHQQQCDPALVQDAFTIRDKHAQSICDHIHHVLMHGLSNPENGYWSFVKYFTRSEAVQTLQSISTIRTDIGRGRAWLCMALNEQSLECYFRMFLENPDIVQQWYKREAFLADVELQLLLLTLLSGLDFITFDLSLQDDYFDFGASPASIESLVPSSKAIDLSITPSFVGSVTVQQQKQLLHSTSDLEASSSPSSSPLSSLTTSSTSQPATAIDHTHSSTPSNKVTDETKQNVEESTVINVNDNLVAKPGAPANLLERMSRAGPDQSEEAVSSRQRRTKGKKKKKKPSDLSGRTKSKRRGSRQQEGESDKKGDIDEAAGNEGGDSVEPSSLTPVEDEATPTTSIADMTEELPDGPVTDTPTADVVSPTDEAIDTPVSDRTASDGAAVSEELKVTEPEEEQAQVTLESESANEQGNYSDVLDKPRNESHVEQLVRQEDTDSWNYDEDFRDLEASGASARSARRGSRRHSPFASGEEDLSSSEECGTTLVTGETSAAYDTQPVRPTLTEEASRAADVPVDDNTRIVLSINVFSEDSEEIKRLIQVKVCTGVGRYQTAYVAVTNMAVYLVEQDNAEGAYSKMMAVPFTQIDHIVVGLSWQTIALIYSKGKLRQKGTHLMKQTIITGSEAVSRSLTNLIRSTAGSVSIPLNRQDESRANAIERELIKLGSNTNMEVVRYSLVHWEQLMGEPPDILSQSSQCDLNTPLTGVLLVKITGGFFASGWSSSFFMLKEGTLFQYNSQNDSSPKASYPLRGLQFGGCTRANENKPFAFNVLDSNGSTMVLAASNEEEMTTWMQSLCLAASGVESPQQSPLHKGGMECGVLLTPLRLHVLVEDSSKELHDSSRLSVQLVTSISIEEVTEIGIDKDLPLYCTISYEGHGLWMLCFSSEYELGQFEKALSEKWKEKFEVELTFVEMSDPAVKLRAKKAVELMMTSSRRSDSITRGRTESIYST